MKPKLEFEILFEDARFIAIDKPVGLLTTHTHLHGKLARSSQRTAENILNDYLRKGQLKSKKRVFLVHRLDRETSGVLLFAKDERTAENLRANWNELARKTYLARVVGELDNESGEFASYLRDDPATMKVASVLDPSRGKLAITKWRALARQKGTTLVEVKLETGRKNQIRVHFSEAGHPIIGDVKYGGEKASRMYLHAWKLEIPSLDMKFESSLEAHGFKLGGYSL